jgi:hypothetical protein
MRVLLVASMLLLGGIASIGLAGASAGVQLGPVCTVHPVDQGLWICVSPGDSSCLVMVANVDGPHSTRTCVGEPALALGEACTARPIDRGAYACVAPSDPSCLVQYTQIDGPGQVTTVCVGA